MLGISGLSGLGIAKLMIRLQKFLSSAGLCSRREGERYIAAGRVKINGVVVRELGTKVDPEKDRVEFKGKHIELKDPPVFIVLHKPRGYVTSCRQKDDKIVLDLVDIDTRIYPVGRLDKDSTGLLILTNDGSLHHKLLHPSYDHEKEYDVTVNSPISEIALNKMRSGLPLMESRTRPADVTRISSRRFRIIIKEGKNRQIRRMVRKVGNRVVKLKRIRVANIKLGALPEGKWRTLTEKEKTDLFSRL